MYIIFECFFFSKIVQHYLAFRDNTFSKLKFNKPEITFCKTNILTTKLQAYKNNYKKKQLETAGYCDFGV